MVSSPLYHSEWNGLKTIVWCSAWHEACTIPIHDSRWHDNEWRQFGSEARGERKNEKIDKFFRNDRRCKFSVLTRSLIEWKWRSIIKLSSRQQTEKIQRAFRTCLWRNSLVYNKLCCWKSRVISETSKVLTVKSTRTSARPELPHWLDTDGQLTVAIELSSKILVSTFFFLSNSKLQSFTYPFEFRCKLSSDSEFLCEEKIRFAFSLRLLIFADDISLSDDNKRFNCEALYYLSRINALHKYHKINFL